MSRNASLNHSDLPNVLLTAFRVREAMSTPFDIDVQFESDDADLDLAKLLWSTANVTLEDDAHERRLGHFSEHTEPTSTACAAEHVHVEAAPQKGGPVNTRGSCVERAPE